MEGSQKVYSVVLASTIEQLEKKVNAALRSGGVCMGSLVFIDSGGSQTFGQPMLVPNKVSTN